ncbi:ArnT family glycosyltransferase, partial [Streptomyces sp. A13(2022)]|uniref:ArnT family glycosyltransferase n=1 Tax=Streptomyces sp. A13(2022) TaxID=2964768 RepID=UPI0021D964E4
AAGLYAWNLSGSGLNSFYSAAVLSGTESWKAWFFGSLDAGNFLTVDKPPLALMVMGLSCRLFGYGTWQMMLPLIGAALATIWILHASVRRVWGHGAAAVAALVLALTPITVAINRDNNPDTLLVFLMVAGAALGLRATRDGRLLPLLGSAVCFGLAFNTKMLQGWIALPAVFLVYVYASGRGWAKRVGNLALAAVALAVASFWWAAAVSLVPASERPYIGGSTDGTAWDLILGYNGLGRILGGDGNMGGGGGGMGGASTELVAYLKKHQDGAKWLLAVSSSQSAAQLILSSGEPVISMWGWSGSDNAMTLARLKELVQRGELHYVQVGGGMGGGPGGGDGLSSQVTAWIQEHGTAVDESEYGGTSTDASDSDSQSGSQSGSQGSQGSQSDSASGLYRLDPADVD